MAGTDKSRVLIVGADGADPKFLARLMSEGKLPHLSRLCEHGTWGALRTTFPPVSPVAWTTCLTGVRPAKHGIRDFITKAQGSYSPAIGLFNVHTGNDGIPVYTSRRAVPTLGEHLSAAERTAYILKVPGTFPPAPLHGGMLAGFGMPDLLGTFGLSAWYTTDGQRKKVAAPQGEELVHPLIPMERNGWRGQIAGPAGTAQEFTLRRDASRAILSLAASIGRPNAVLGVGDWSGWVRVTFAVPGRGSVAGICRFKLVSFGRDVELYRTAVQCAPDAPLFAVSEPAGFGALLASWLGPFATLGMPADLDGVRRGVVDLDTFLEDAYANWEQQIEMTLRLIASAEQGMSPWDLLITHLFTVDNVQHLFWHCQDPLHPAYRPHLADRFGDEIERAYRWLDTRLGQLVECAGPQTTVMVVSDHGGAPIHRLVYMNTWLQAHGYLVPHEIGKERTARKIDWSRTRAAMFGTGGIWLNVQGREPEGIVPPGASYEALRQEIARSLSAWRDPQTGQQVCNRVLLGESVFGADARQNGPDLVPAFQPGYGLGRGEGLGRVTASTPLIVPNLTPWSGGHEGPYLPSEVPGICILYGPRIPAGTDIRRAGLEDIVPTVLNLLGVRSTRSMDGHSLL